MVVAVGAKRGTAKGGAEGKQSNTACQDRGRQAQPALLPVFFDLSQRAGLVSWDSGAGTDAVAPSWTMVKGIRG